MILKFSHLSFRENVFTTKITIIICYLFSFPCSLMTVLTDLKCDKDSDCTHARNSICHPGLGLCTCPAGYEFIDNRFACCELSIILMACHALLYTQFRGLLLEQGFLWCRCIICGLLSISIVFLTYGSLSDDCNLSREYNTQGVDSLTHAKLISIQTHLIVGCSIIRFLIGQIMNFFKLHELIHVYLYPPVSTFT